MFLFATYLLFNFVSHDIGTKHGSARAFAYERGSVVIVRSDSETKGISIFSHPALREATPRIFKLEKVSSAKVMLH